MGAMKNFAVSGTRRNDKDPYFDPVRDRRMSELTVAQQLDAQELWLIQQLDSMQDYYKGHLAFLLDRIAGLRGELQQATTHLAAVTHQGEFAVWLDAIDPEMPLAAAKEWAEASQWTAKKLGIPEAAQVDKTEVDPTHQFHAREDGLLHCRQCNGAEASLPTECPRVPMSPVLEEAVQRGQIDYVGSRWVHKARSASDARSTLEQSGAAAPLQAISLVLRDAMDTYPGSRETPDYAVELAIWLAGRDGCHIRGRATERAPA